MPSFPLHHRANIDGLHLPFNVRVQTPNRHVIVCCSEAQSPVMRKACSDLSDCGEQLTRMHNRYCNYIISTFVWRKKVDVIIGHAMFRFCELASPLPLQINEYKRHEMKACIGRGGNNPRILDMAHSLMELSPSWESANCAATQEFSSILWNPTVHYRVHKSLPPVSIMSQINTVDTTLSYLSKIHFNIVHQPTSWSS
jgi:hypothetical protein